LDGFEIGQEYEVGTSLGTLLLAEGWAVPVPLEVPPPFVPFSENDPFDSRVLYRERDTPPNLSKDPASRFLEKAVAAEAFRRRRTPRSR
jgi:hypothetical protein